MMMMMMTMMMTRTVTMMMTTTTSQAARLAWARQVFGQTVQINCPRTAHRFFGKVWWRQ